MASSRDLVFAMNVGKVWLSYTLLKKINNRQRCKVNTLNFTNFLNSIIYFKDVIINNKIQSLWVNWVRMWVIFFLLKSQFHYRVRMNWQRPACSIILSKFWFISIENYFEKLTKIIWNFDLCFHNFCSLWCF